MGRLALEYLMLVFVASVGVLQLAAGYSQLKGLSLFPRPWQGYLCSGLLILGAFLWFFHAEDRNYQGIEGLQQFLLFSVAACCAVLFTLFLSSCRQRRWGASGLGAEAGLEALRERGYWQAWRQRRRVNAGG